MERGNNQNSTLRQTAIPMSNQTSFNDYTSNHNKYGEIKMFPKVENYLNEKTGSLLTAQQQQQVKNFQKMLQESQTVDQ